MEDDSDDASSVGSLGFEVELPSDGEEDSIAPADGSLELDWEASAPPDDGESDRDGDGDGDSQEFPAAPDDTSQEFPAAPADTSQDDEAEESERQEHTQTVAADLQEEPSQAREESAMRPDAAAERASGEPDGEADARAEPGPPEEHPEDQAEQQESPKHAQDTEPMPEQEQEQVSEGEEEGAQARAEPQAAGLDEAQQAEVVQGPAVEMACARHPGDSQIPRSTVEIVSALQPREAPPERQQEPAREEPEREDSAPEQGGTQTGGGTETIGIPDSQASMGERAAEVIRDGTSHPPVPALSDPQDSRALAAQLDPVDAENYPPEAAAAPEPSEAQSSGAGSARGSIATLSLPTVNLGESAASPATTTRGSPSQTQASVSQSQSQALFSLGGGIASLGVGESQSQSQSQPTAQSESQSMWNRRRHPEDASLRDGGDAATAAESGRADEEGEDDAAGYSLSLRDDSESQNLMPTRKNLSSEFAPHISDSSSAPAPAAAAPSAARAVQSRPAAGFRSVRGTGGQSQAADEQVVEKPAAERSSQTNAFSETDVPEESQHVERAAQSPEPEAAEQASPVAAQDDSPTVDSPTTDGASAARLQRAQARAEHRTQRLCKYQYTRNSFKHRAPVTNHGSRLDRVIEKAGGRQPKAAAAEAPSPAAKSESSLTSAADDVPEDPDKAAAKAQPVEQVNDEQEQEQKEQKEEQEHEHEEPGQQDERQPGEQAEEEQPPQEQAASAEATDEAADSWENWQDWESSGDEDEDDADDSDDEDNEGSAEGHEKEDDVNGADSDDTERLAESEEDDWNELSAAEKKAREEAKQKAGQQWQSPDAEPERARNAARDSQAEMSPELDSTTNDAFAFDDKDAAKTRRGPRRDRPPSDSPSKIRRRGGASRGRTGSGTEDDSRSRSDEWTVGRKGKTSEPAPSLTQQFRADLSALEGQLSDEGSPASDGGAAPEVILPPPSPTAKQPASVARARALERRRRSSGAKANAARGEASAEEKEEVPAEPSRVQTRSSQRSQREGGEKPVSDAWREQLAVGSRCDALDPWGKWYEGLIVDERRNDFCTEARSVRVHFMNWSDKYQEWVDISSASLQPLNTHPHEPGGDAPGYVPRLRGAAQADQEEEEDSEAERKAAIVRAKYISKRSARLMRGCKRHRPESLESAADTSSQDDDEGAGAAADGAESDQDFSDHGGSGGFEVDESQQSEEITSDGDDEPLAARRSARRVSPIVTRRGKASPQPKKKKKASWIQGGRWDLAGLNLSRQTMDTLNRVSVPDPAPLPKQSVGASTWRGKTRGAMRTRSAASTATTDDDAPQPRKRKRPSKNRPQAAAEDDAAADPEQSTTRKRRRRSGANAAQGEVSQCEECGGRNDPENTAALSSPRSSSDGSPPRRVCDQCAKRREYLRSRAKMGTVVARVCRRAGSASPASRARSAKLFDGIDFAMLDGAGAGSAAADAARDLVAKQIRSCGGNLVRLTPKFVRELDKHAKLVCLCSAPMTSASYLLSLAVGVLPLSPEWAVESMQKQALQPLKKFQCKPLRVPGVDKRACTAAAAAAAKRGVGKILPTERRVLRTNGGKAPLQLAVRGSESFVREWEPLLRAAGADCKPTATSAARSKAPKVHAYVCDGTDQPSAGSRVPCVSLSWLFASLAGQRRRGFKDDKSFEVTPRAVDPPSPTLSPAEEQCSQQF